MLQPGQTLLVVSQICWLRFFLKDYATEVYKKKDKTLCVLILSKLKLFKKCFCKI